MKVDGKVLVVTGAGSAMGRTVTLELLRRGASVAAVDLRPEGLEELSATTAAGPRLVTFTLDVTAREAVAALPGRVIDALGVIDGIVNNAGIIQPFRTVLELDDEVIDRVLEVNLRSQITTSCTSTSARTRWPCMRCSASRRSRRRT